MDKNQAIIDFLLECPQIQENPLFFNYIKAKDESKQIITSANERVINRKYIDGSVLKRYTFTIIDFKSIADVAIVKEVGYANENVEELSLVQTIIDWVDAQAELKHYPNFGDTCIIENMGALTDNPDLNGIDTSLTPALAKYSVAIQIDYLDISKTLWK